MKLICLFYVRIFSDFSIEYFLRMNLSVKPYLLTSQFRKDLIYTNEDLIISENIQRKTY